MLSDTDWFLTTYFVSETGCWVWRNYRDRHGYGRLGRRRAERLGHSAHRVAYELHVGPIPDGLTIDHTCCNRACVNPAHLEPVTNVENARRAAQRRTHCKNGHAWTSENTRPGKTRANGTRQLRLCRACSRINSSRWKQKKRELEAMGFELKPIRKLKAVGK